MSTTQNNSLNDRRVLMSFIVPVYNVPPGMLADCIRSILKLSLRRFERQIIVVDDGSDSSPLDELLKLSDDIVYLRQQNAGVSAARNAGLRMAEGEFVQFVDADDLLAASAYEHVLDLLRYSPVDMVMFDFCKQPTETALFDEQGPMTGVSLLSHHNIRGSACCYAFRRSILGSLRFTPDIAYGEDDEFTPQLLLRAGRVCLTSAQAYVYRERPTSATGRSDLRSRLRRLADNKRVLLHLHRKCQALPEPQHEALSRRTAQLTMDYIYNVIVLTRSRHFLDRRLGELRQAGLFPLPDGGYTTKYNWFRRMTGTSAGRYVLVRTLPLLTKER